MSDVFREVDDELRQDELKRLWDRVGPFVIGAAALIILGTAGWRGYEYWQTSQSQESGDRFIKAVELFKSGKTEQANADLAILMSEGSGGYPVLARFLAASEKAKAGDAKEAVSRFDAIAADTTLTEELRNLARLRSGMILINGDDYKALVERLKPLATAGNAWRHTARELLGLAAMKAGKTEEALGYFEQVLADATAPRDIISRAAIAQQMLNASGKAPEAKTSLTPLAPAATPAAGDTPKPDAAKTETPQTETPKAEAPKAETPALETPKAAAPAGVMPKAETPKADTPTVAKPEPKAEESGKKPASADETANQVKAKVDAEKAKVPAKPAGQNETKATEPAKVEGAQ